MLEKLLKPYRIIVSEKAKIAGFENRNFPNKKSALVYVKRIRAVDPEFNANFQVVFRFIDTSTGQLYLNRKEYEHEQERRRNWQEKK